jgi:hypothetical protein
MLTIGPLRGSCKAKSVPVLSAGITLRPVKLHFSRDFMPIFRFANSERHPNTWEVIFGRC